MAQGIKWSNNWCLVVETYNSCGGWSSGKRSAFCWQWYGSNWMSRSISRTLHWDNHNSRAISCKLLQIICHTVMSKIYWHIACCSYNENVVKIYKIGNFLHKKIKYYCVASNALPKKVSNCNYFCYLFWTTNNYPVECTFVSGFSSGFGLNIHILVPKGPLENWIIE